jgi:hypothetical protein
MDGRFSQNQRTEFLALGKRLRGSLLNLISAQFDDGTQAVLNANQQLNVVNTQLSDAVTALANFAQVVNNISDLVSDLDQLLKVAASFL